MYLALPRELVIGPPWLLPTLILVLLPDGREPSHRPALIKSRSRHPYQLHHHPGLDRIGNPAGARIAINKMDPLSLLLAGGELWLTNVLVFALWYWRLDGGGPTLRRERKEFGSHSFVFPQMQIEKTERARFACEAWRSHFADYLFVAFTQSSTFGPTDAPLLARWAKILAMIQISISLSIVILLISRAVGVL